jgi:glycosyltransferase involved in cell wall biosynthesis
MKIGVMLRSIDEKQGIGIYSQNLMDHLLPLDQKNEYVLFYHNSQFLGRYGRLEHVTEKLVKAPNKAIWDQVKIPLEAQREGVDLIFHTKFTVPFLTSCKTMMVLHGSSWFIHPEWYKFADRISIRLLMKLYCRKASCIISNSNMTKQDFVDILNVHKDKIKTIYFGFNPIFEPIDDHVYLESIRKKYGLPRKFILYVGRIDPGKNFGHLIKAFSKIHTSLQHIMVVAGHPRWGHESDYASIKKLGLQEKVLFTDWVPHEDLAAIYNLADLFVFPSFYEGFGIPLLEAMACGCPAIVSGTGAFPEIAGEAALLINPHNPDETAEAIRKILTDDSLRNALRKKGLLRAKAFNWDKCARETIAVFESLNGKAN